MGYSYPQIESPLEEGGGAEDPTYRVLGTVRGDQHPDDGEGYRQDRDADDVLVDQDLARGAPVEGAENQAPGG